jgi:hypothetical protein
MDPTNPSHFPMLATDRASEIRIRMAQIRGQMSDSAHTVAVQAQRTTDWRTYVLRHPWIWAGGAALVGYLLIPKKQTVVLDSKAVEKAVKVATDKAAQHAEPAKTAAWTALAMGVLQAAALQGIKVFLESKVRQMAAHHSSSSDETAQQPKRPR